MKIYLPLVAMLAVGATAQNFPDAPLPAYNAPTQSTYDRQLWVATGVNLAAKASDIAQTCVVLRNGGSERWLPPPHNCGGVAMWIAIDAGASVLASNWLVKHNHHRMAVWLQYASAAGNVAGITYTRMHWDERGPVYTKVAPR